MKPEAQARTAIDDLLEEAGWASQGRKGLNLGACQGLAVREFALATGAAALVIDTDAFDEVPFNQHGGLGRVYQLFGAELPDLLTDLNERLVA